LEPPEVYGPVLWLVPIVPPATYWLLPARIVPSPPELLPPLLSSYISVTLAPPWYGLWKHNVHCNRAGHALATLEDPKVNTDPGNGSYPSATLSGRTISSSRCAGAPGQDSGELVNGLVLADDVGADPASLGDRQAGCLRPSPHSRAIGP
jgi:hypothetical protein